MFQDVNTCLQQVEVQPATRHPQRCHLSTSCCTMKEDGAARQRAAATTRETSDTTCPIMHSSIAGFVYVNRNVRSYCGFYCFLLYLQGDGTLPVLQVRQDGADEEVHSLVKARRKQRAPQRCSLCKAAGDPAVYACGCSLRTETEPH